MRRIGDATHNVPCPAYCDRTGRREVLLRESYPSFRRFDVMGSEGIGLDLSMETG